MTDATPPARSLQALRQQIDAVDRELLALLNRRAGLALAVGEIKKQEGSVVFRPEREAQVIDGLKAANPGPLQTESVAPIWREIMSACRALETPTRVAYLGPAGTFSELAALGLLRLVDRSRALRQHRRGVPQHRRRRRRLRRRAGRELDRRRGCTLARPVPDHAAGASSARPACSCATTCCASCDSLDGIGAVCAHPQALAQCHSWLSNHLPNVERRPVASNAEGARLASLDASLAGIASERAASEYGLHLVAPAIQDDPHNRTRFAIVTAAERHPQPRASGHDCTSLVVSVANRPGAVHDMLVPLKVHGVSMTRFESRPARSGQWEYYFYIDIAGHPDEPHVATALKELRSVCAFYKLLGTYPLDTH